ncbi:MULTISPECIES: hypothetical protein [Actinoalloteichus]|uniref:Uncharacterized protein n=1 Tax=Actinoalloteichus fjordicus TaxID=1612552 RepID=A0AAC9PSI3_9PSEU|nr:MULTISPECIES: hypothetical protein [Actinoalloteichus]APU14871.1 hypothetical protein UA74_14065 [Actinoalloteichus fjordicus]APU20840.1 hypothetical protein UA75_14150 [Actinoalloteichus sp. GBA129-24]
MIGLRERTEEGCSGEARAVDPTERAWRRVGPGGTAEWLPHQDGAGDRRTTTPSVRSGWEAGSAASSSPGGAPGPMKGAETASRRAPAVMLLIAAVLLMYQDQPFALLYGAATWLGALVAPGAGGTDQGWWVLVFGMDLPELAFTGLPLAALLLYAVLTRRR